LAAICHRSEGNHPTDNGPPGETLHEHFFSEQYLLVQIAMI
jgi:hypothetical protein